jgi:hypothetical protein
MKQKQLDSSRIDRRLEKIQILLEKGQQKVLDSHIKVFEELHTINDKVDKVQDTVTYIKKKITTITPWRLGFLLILAIILWTWFLFFFHFVNLS